MKNKSKCRTCGEQILETGNYQIKIIKAKRIPKKLQKLVKSERINNPATKSSLSQSKFGKFLLKRSQPFNEVEITCGKCSSSSKIRAIKPLRKEKAIAKTSAVTSHSRNSSFSKSTETPGSSSKRRKKRGKDANAGLFIPSANESFDKVDDKPATTATYLFQSGPSGNSQKPQNPPTTNNPPQKDLENLRKAFIKSKKRSSAGNKGTSLKDFLSSM